MYHLQRCFAVMSPLHSRALNSEMRRRSISSATRIWYRPQKVSSIFISQKSAPYSFLKSQLCSHFSKVSLVVFLLSKVSSVVFLQKSAQFSKKDPPPRRDKALVPHRLSGEDAQNVLNCTSLSAKEPLNKGLSCEKVLINPPPSWQGLVQTLTRQLDSLCFPC